MHATLHRARGRAGRLRAALGRGRATARAPADARARSPPASTTSSRRWRSWEAEHDVYEGRAPRARAAQRARAEGPDLPADGRDRRRADEPRCRRRVGGERNWDYRFSWIRDSSLTLEALYIGACSDEAEEFVSFMTSSAGGRASGGSLQIMYGIRGEHDLSERELTHLRGWRDSRPVRVGNGAWNQTQLDVYGELLNALHVYHERLGELHPEIQAFVADLADTAARRWRETDSGIWEMRGEPRHHLSSKVLCWTALDRAVKLAPKLGEHAKVEAWAAERDAHPRRDPRARLERGQAGLRAVLRLRRARRRRAADADLRLPPGHRRRACARPSRRSRATSPRTAWSCATATQEGLNADGLTGEEGTFVDLLVLARLLPGARPARSSAREALFDAARRLRQRPRPARRGDRHRQRRAARQLPAGLQPHRADHGRVRDRPGQRRADGTRMSTDYDVIVIGGGPGGRALRRRPGRRRPAGGDRRARAASAASAPTGAASRPRRSCAPARRCRRRATAPGAREAVAGPRRRRRARSRWRDFMVSELRRRRPGLPWAESDGHRACCAATARLDGPGRGGRRRRRFSARRHRASPPARSRSIPPVPACASSTACGRTARPRR